MKSKQEILAALARSNEERLLLAGLLDKEQTCVSRGYLTVSYTHLLFPRRNRTASSLFF